MPNDDARDPHPAARPPPAPEPAAERDPKILLDHIAEVSRNARANWLGLLALLAFVGIALMSHKDADFFGRGVETQLPLIGITVPTRSFFLAASLLIAALYIYLHVYLLNLWDVLADFPQEKDAPPLADRVFPWMMSHAALWYRNRRRSWEPPSASPRVFGWLTVAITLLFGWGFGLIVLAALWWRSMPAHEWWLTLVTGAAFAVSAGVGLTTFLTATKRLYRTSREAVMHSRPAARLALWGFFLLVILVSAEKTTGDLVIYCRGEACDGRYVAFFEGADLRNERARQYAEQRLSDPPGDIWNSLLDLQAIGFFALARADLREAELTPRPADWRPYQVWRDDFEKTWRADNEIEGRMSADAEKAFLADAERRWRLRVEALAAPDLKGRDLRGADLTRAFLPGADLRGATLAGAEMRYAVLSGAQLECLEPARMRGETEEDCTDLSRANLGDSRLEGANLAGSRLEGANLNSARLEGSELRGVRLDAAVVFAGAVLEGANLMGVDLRGSDLFGADMRGAELSFAGMEEMELRESQMQRAQLRAARLRGANLTGADMRQADLSETSLDSAMLRVADLDGANLSRARMQRADLVSARLEGANLSGASLEAAVVGHAVIGASVLHGADFTGASGLRQPQLEQAIGDSETILPQRLRVWSCWSEPPATLDRLLATYPEEERQARRADWLCGEGEVPQRVGRHPEPAGAD